MTDHRPSRATDRLSDLLGMMDDLDRFADTANKVGHALRQLSDRLADQLTETEAEDLDDAAAILQTSTPRNAADLIGCLEDEALDLIDVLGVDRAEALADELDSGRLILLVQTWWRRQPE